jgi:tRNA (cmo5U34)-methyltransferase
MTDFDKSHWAQKDFSNQYLEDSDIYIVERRRLFEILKSFYKCFLANKRSNKILDLGCGDGILTQELLKIDGGISATLVDGSQEMLGKAKKKLSGFKDVNYVRASFQEMLRKDVGLSNFDFVVSSLAIHHLAMDEKKSLFEHIYSRLNSGGYFVNIDVVFSPTEDLEKWYLLLWKEHIREAQTRLKLEGNYEDIVERYKSNTDNKPDALTDQLEALKSAGFEEVDCFYKYGIFTIFGGRKPRIAS